MKITFLGTGTSQGIPVIGCECEVCGSDDPRDKRLRTSVLIEVGDKKIGVDAGPDFRQQMLRAKVQNLDALLLTHEHNDHIIGLDDVRPFNFRYKKDMPIYAVERVQAELKQRFAYIFAENPYPGAPRLALHTIDKDHDFRVGDIPVTPIEVLHGKMPVLGFRIADFIYVTDAKIIEAESLAKMKKAKILVLNALHFKTHHSHLNLPEALEIIEKLQPERAYLTHFSHNLGTHEGISPSLPDNVFLAYDGLELTV
ncbi:MAG: MBL fold metallo-hydrolase [Saprospiraceae bacterium]